MLGGLFGESRLPKSRKVYGRKTPGKKSNAENVKVPATVNELLNTMQVVPGPVLPAALPL